MTSSFAKTEHITRLRAEELLKEAWSLTLGQLAARVRYRLPAELGERLTTAIAQRNFLAHHFWYDRVHLMTSEAGAASLIHELEEIAEALQSLDADIGAYAKPYKERIGLTAKAHQEALRDVLEGRDGGPLWPQRLPRKTERLVRAHHAKVEGRAMLVFEADDSTLWSYARSD